MEKGTKTYFWVIFITLACVNLPFISVNLNFIFQDSSCILEEVSGISMALKNWLLVDALTKIGMIAPVLIIALISGCQMTMALKLYTYWIYLCIFYGMFNVSWLIFGAVLFWGSLDKEGICSEEITGYMYAVLILGFVCIIGNGYLTYK